MRACVCGIYRMSVRMLFIIKSCGPFSAAVGAEGAAHVLRDTANACDSD